VVAAALGAVDPERGAVAVGAQERAAGAEAVAAVLVAAAMAEAVEVPGAATWVVTSEAAMAAARAAEERVVGLVTEVVPEVVWTEASADMSST